jgi:hypothetical protein
METLKKMFEACGERAVPTAPSPDEVNIIVRGGDTETFDKMMSSFVEHATEYELRPVRRIDEPAVAYKAHWGEFCKNPRAASIYGAIEMIDQINRLRLQSELKKMAH